jgi:hypothetical protein
MGLMTIFYCLTALGRFDQSVERVSVATDICLSSSGNVFILSLPSSGQNLNYHVTNILSQTCFHVIGIAVVLNFCQTAARYILFSIRRGARAAVWQLRNIDVEYV